MSPNGFQPIKGWNVDPTTMLVLPDGPFDSPSPDGVQGFSPESFPLGEGHAELGVFLGAREWDTPHGTLTIIRHEFYSLVSLPGAPLGIVRANDRVNVPLGKAGVPGMLGGEGFLAVRPRFGILYRQRDAYLELDGEVVLRGRLLSANRYVIADRTGPVLYRKRGLVHGGASWLAPRAGATLAVQALLLRESGLMEGASLRGWMSI